MNYPKRSCTHRMKGHDYRATWKYHLTLLKNPDAPYFCHLADGWREAALTHRREAVKMEYTPAGKAVRDALFEWKSFAPKISLLQYSIMPDHLHLLIQVNETLEEHLGRYVARLKTVAGHRLQYRKSLLAPPAANQPAEPPFLSLFAEGFNDQILWTTRTLDTVFQYVKNNPYKLAIRKAHPDFFTHLHNLTLNLPTGQAQHPTTPVRLQAYGNLQLLGNPFKEQVVVHRADTPEQRERNRQRWLYTAANGGVLVSPYISPAEKAIRVEAEVLGARHILITHTPMPDRYKPAAHDFDLCAAGLLLILSAPTQQPWLPPNPSRPCPVIGRARPITPPSPISRTTCRALNALASAISSEQSPHLFNTNGQ